MNKTKDMTVGSPTKTIFFFSVPVLLGTLFQQIYNMADTIIVGQFLGEDALAAVGATGSTVYLVIGFASGLTQGCGILVSQAFGGHRLNELKKVVGTALLLTVVFSVILTIPTVSFSRQILLALHTPSNVLLYAHEYLRVIFGGILCTMAYNIAASILRSLGDSRTPLYFLILSSFLNIVLDIFFIATLHMGTAGAAWATVLSQGISALLCFWYMFHNYNNLRLSIRDLYPDPYRILCMIQSGIPMALNQTVTAFGIMILQSGINQFGSSVMAAYTAASKLESLVMQPMIALGSGISTYCAQNIGARKTKRIFVGVRSTMLLSLGAAILGMALYGIASKAILRIFLSDPSSEMVHYALQYLYTSVWFLLFLAWIFLFRNALVGLGNGLVTIIGGVAELLCRFLCIHFLLQPFGFWCICLTNPITWIVACSLFCGFYFRWEHQQKHCSKSAR